jgi:hypothetical protein
MLVCICIFSLSRSQRGLLKYTYNQRLWAWIFLFGLYGGGVMHVLFSSQLISSDFYEFGMHYHMWVTFSQGILG